MVSSADYFWIYKIYITYIIYNIYIYICRASGANYVGMWMHSQRHGKGVMTRHDLTRYSGEWKQDVIRGTGTIYKYFIFLVHGFNGLYIYIL